MNSAIWNGQKIVPFCHFRGFFISYTGNNRYSGNGYSGIDRYSGTKNPDDAILFTVSGITILVELFLENLGF